MWNWKEIGKKLLFPPVWLVLVLAVITTIGLVAIFVNGWDTHPVACGFYVIAAYALTVVCALCYKVFPKGYRIVNAKVHGNKYADRYLTDVVFKTELNLYRSLIINLIYVATNAISAILYKSHWFAVIAVYYGVMAIMRFLLVRYMGKNTLGDNFEGELRRARLCALILLTINLTLSGAVLMMAYRDKGFAYPGFLIYVIALYTFYITTAAIVSLAKQNSRKNPIVGVTNMIKMASALFSMLFLETAMFAQFGGDTDPVIKRNMILATGAGISITVVFMGIYTIARTTINIRKEKTKKEQLISGK